MENQAIPTPAKPPGIPQNKNYSLYIFVKVILWIGIIGGTLKGITDSVHFIFYGLAGIGVACLILTILKCISLIIVLLRYQAGYFWFLITNVGYIIVALYNDDILQPDPTIMGAIFNVIWVSLLLFIPGGRRGNCWQIMAEYNAAGRPTNH